MAERRLGALALIALAFGIGLNGCGGDGGSTATSARGQAEKKNTTKAGGTGKGNEGAEAGGARELEKQLAPAAQIDLAIKGVLASAAPKLACRRYATLRYVEKTFGGRAGCVESTVPASAADAVKVSKIEIDGDDATARAVPSGGPSNGEMIRVELVRQGGIWKVRSLRSNAPVGP
jgi:hypothetical protein